VSGRQRCGADGKGVALEHSGFKTRLYALEQQAESRIAFLYLLPTFLDRCGRPHRQEENPVFVGVFLGESDVVQHYFPECAYGFSPARAVMSFCQFFKAFRRNSSKQSLLVGE